LGSPPHEPEALFPIVGIGASAGGLEAFTQLLQPLSGNPGLAFVLVQHLDPTRESMLSELLSRVTPMLGRVDEFAALAYGPLYDQRLEGNADGRTLALHRRRLG